MLVRHARAIQLRHENVPVSHQGNSACARIFKSLDRFSSYGSIFGDTLATMTHTSNRHEKLNSLAAVPFRPVICRHFLATITAGTIIAACIGKRKKQGRKPKTRLPPARGSAESASPRMPLVPAGRYKFRLFDAGGCTLMKYLNKSGGLLLKLLVMGPTAALLMSHSAAASRSQDASLRP